MKDVVARKNVLKPQLPVHISRLIHTYVLSQQYFPHCLYRLHNNVERGLLFPTNLLSTSLYFITNTTHIEGFFVFVEKINTKWENMLYSNSVISMCLCGLGVCYLRESIVMLLLYFIL